MKYELWTEKEKAELLHCVAVRLPLDQIAERIRRSPESIKQKIKRSKYEYWDKNWRNKLRFTTETYLEKFKKVHGNLYEYPDFQYKGASKKYTIACRTHGRFEQTAINHSLGVGCPSCADERNRLTTTEFIEKATKVHGAKYDYAKSKYTTGREDIIIGCPIHGYYRQKAGVHLAGHGCNRCRREKRKPTQQDFIKRCVETHGNTYDYSLTEYIANNRKVLITCRVHGEFYQTPNKHLKGRGCDRCGGSYLKTTDEFIREAVKVHGERYDYKSAVYHRAHKKVRIVCRKHGEFLQTPASHLYGKGCPYCCSSIGESEVKRWLVESSIDFVRQKKFEHCKDKRLLPFDFYLPSRNICIEYNGRQHYMLIPFFGEKVLNAYKKHDQIKSAFCVERGINLIVIKYTDDVNTILTKELL